MICWSCERSLDLACFSKRVISIDLLMATWYRDDVRPATQMCTDCKRALAVRRRLFGKDAAQKELLRAVARSTIVWGL
jgi:hypothetical protein